MTQRNIVFSVSPGLWPLAKGKAFWPPVFGWSLFAAAFSSSHRDWAHEEELGLRGGGKDRLPAPTGKTPLATTDREKPTTGP